MTLALFCGLSILAIGCTTPSATDGTTGSTTTTDSDAQKDKLTIAMVPKGTAHEFWKTVHAGADDAAKELGVNLIWKGPLNENDREQQIKVIEDFVTQKVSGICVAPLDDKALRNPVDEALKEKIPVLVFDSGLADFTGTVSFVATDNKKGGMIAAEAMAKSLGKGGKVIVLRYIEGSASTNQREEGFLEAAKAAGLEIVSDNQYAGATVDTAMSASENLMNRFRDSVQGIFCPNESSTAGMLKVLQDLKLAGKVAFYGFDASEKLVAALGAGEINGLVVQNPYKMGKLSVESMVKAIKGEKVESRLDTGATLVNKENMSQPDIDKVLHPPKI
ncbi:MAG: substrate-binding domain-containing protein [Chthonomonadaceae bacterium]|nr:substrate-binding domain-containing protein [Chthonomonadaceae bacterium]